MRDAYVTTNLLDLWSRPQFNSERVSQLLFGETVTISSVRGDYARVIQADGYTGWALQAHLKIITRRRAATYAKRINSVVTGEKAVLHNPRTGSPQPHFVYYGTRLYCPQRGMGFVRCKLPDSSVVLLKPQRIRPISSKRGEEATPAQLIAEAKRFLGVPYLWGGVAPSGFDCSGFVRAIFGRFGVHLPRDTKAQIRCGESVARENVRAGDLLFFERHVGLAMPGERIIHASVGGMGVRINSLKADGENYRPDLDQGFITARRILC